MRLPVKVTEIVSALERESTNGADPRCRAANQLRQMDDWERRTLMCEVDTNPQSEVMTAEKPYHPGAMEW